MAKFRPQSGEIIHTEFHPATSAYGAHMGTCHHYPAYAKASVRCNDQNDADGFYGSFVSVNQRGDETDAQTVARAKGMFLRGVRGIH